MILRGSCRFLSLIGLAEGKKEEEEKKGGGCERGETETCRRVLTAGGWRCEEKIIGILMLWVEALVVNI